MSSVLETIVFMSFVSLVFCFDFGCYRQKDKFGFCQSILVKSGSLEENM